MSQEQTAAAQTHRPAAIAATAGAPPISRRRQPLPAGTIVAMRIGSIGLMLAVPLKTVLAAVLARGLAAAALPEDEYHHRH